MKTRKRGCEATGPASSGFELRPEGNRRPVERPSQSVDERHGAIEDVAPAKRFEGAGGIGQRQAPEVQRASLEAMSRP